MSRFVPMLISTSAPAGRQAAVVAVVAALTSGCVPGTQPLPGPPALGLDAAGVYRAYLAAQPAQFKLRHQVAVQVRGQEQIMHGVLVVQRPGRFWVRAMTPVGVSLFDVRAERGGEAAVTQHAATLPDPRMAETLRQDIERIYLIDCPVDARALLAGRVVRVSCDLDDAAGDERLQVDLTPGGVALAKRFVRNGTLAATVDYAEYKELDGRWWAHRITVSRPELPYRLSIALLDADTAYDAARLFSEASD